jgi:hypothetical protein
MEIVDATRVIFAMIVSPTVSAKFVTNAGN